MEIPVLILLIFLNGFFALSEIAMVSSKKARLEQYKKEGSKGAKTALKLLGNSENFLSAVQVGISLIAIITGVYGGISIADEVVPILEKFESIRLYAYEIALTLTVIIITYFSIVFGELLPKIIALSNPERIAIKVAPIIFWFNWSFYPFVRILALSTGLISKFFGIKKQSEFLSEEELRQMIKIASHEGVIESEQKFIHEKVFYFADKKAKHIMTHRTDIEWIDIEKPEAINNNLIRSSKHSKIIVCQRTLDNFIGTLSVKEYLIRINEYEKVTIQELIDKPIIIPENTSAQRVIDLFRKQKKHLAIVVNEYGGFEGIITLHDIMENLIGEVPEEDEQVEPDIFIREDKSVLVSGEAPIETLSQVMEDFTIDFEEIDYSTVAGFILSRINKLPRIGDKFSYGEYNIEIVDIDGNKIDKILVTKRE